MSQAFYVRLGEGRYESSPHTAGPWGPDSQHGGPPASLLAHEMARAAGDELCFVRFTYELLGPVPVDEVVVETAVARPGKRVQMVEGALTARGRVAMRARAWQVAPTEAESVPPAGYHAPPRPDTPAEVTQAWASGYINAIEWRFATGGFEVMGPAAAWTRPRIALVQGEPLPDVARVLLVADSGSGVSSALDLRDWLFINPELTVHVLRPPRGEWVCLDAKTAIANGGPGLASSTLSDDDGPVAYAVQSLLVAPR